jgi:hypothetical protein
MRAAFTPLLLAASLLLSAAALAEVRIYNHKVKFAPSTPASIQAKAYEPIEFTVLGQRQELSALYLPPPLDPSIQYIQQPTQDIVAEYLNQDMVGPISAVVLPDTVTTLRVPGLTAGKYRIRLRYPKGEIFDEREIVVNAGGNPVVVETIGENGPNAFHLSWFASGPFTATPAIGVPGGRRWGAWQAGASAPSVSIPLYLLTLQFEGTVFSFYTVSETERAALRTMGWQDNGAFVNVLAASGGTCAVGAEPVYRAFRPARVGSWRATHRYTSDATAYREWVRSSAWAGEGVMFCARVLTESIAETTTF